MDYKENNLQKHLSYFQLMYKRFLDENKILIESNKPNYIIDFDSWEVNTNGTGVANIWVEPKEIVLFQPNYSPLRDIEIKGLQVIVKTKLLMVKPNYKLISFEMLGHFNPDDWHGRNAIKSLSPGQTIVTGVNRVILEQDVAVSMYFLKYIEQNFRLFFDETLRFFNF